MNAEGAPDNESNSTQTPSFDAHEKLFDFAQDTTKQIITLSSGIVALTITFFKDFASGASEFSRHLMTVAWVGYVLSVIAGLLVLLALTGALTTKEPSPSLPNATLFTKNVLGK